ncbi:spore germination protein GerPB [Alkalihalobacillus sp. AL-G]|uniref:spore germination protein GerPB n=1 Tax=Alkalihalobacillus sp. AL-G TaxID=2926399 RepID=UPI0027299452|nr:spore germination protein GerPB [Alkalihalobacillus sp. AL-G]WLD91588.1 spore germination protein GerPB [Alkalihalobacillus sp. AL-G]
MKLFVNQTISIQTLRIDGLSNSSVLQIGTCGVMKPSSYLYNTGGFTGPAPEMTQPFDGVYEPSIEGPLVPLNPPT